MTTLQEHQLRWAEMKLIHAGSKRLSREPKELWLECRWSSVSRRESRRETLEEKLIAAYAHHRGTHKPNRRPIGRGMKQLSRDT